VKIHCSILAEDAIKAAVADYKTRHGGAQGSAGVGVAQVPQTQKLALEQAAD